MSPKVLSIFNNAKIFLTPEELRELQLCINKELGQNATLVKKKKTNLGPEWTIEAVTERLLANQFNKNKKKK